MGYMSDYYACKDAERADGSVDFDQVPRRNGGYKDTGHPEDTKWWDGPGDRPQGARR